MTQNGSDPSQTSQISAVPAGVDTSEQRRVVSLSDEVLATIQELPADSALLLVHHGPNTGARFLLDTESTRAGRHPSVDIFLDDVTVSRRHAEFIRQGERFYVRDLGSLNGTYVNRERIDEVELSTGDEVQIGKYRLTFHASPSRNV